MAARPVVKIAVLGDAGVGKTSLISTAANDTFDVRPAPVLPPTRLPAEFTPDHVPMVVTDTSSRPEDQQVTDLVLQASDVVVVCFDATRQATLDSVRSHWYARVQSLNPGVPVIMACCKADRLTEEREVNLLRERVEATVHDLPHVEVCLNCSAKTLRMVADVFFYALKSVLYPLQPLYDRLEKRLRPLCVRAMKRVFTMCDADGDGALSDAELNAFQLACFGMALDESELQNVKQIVAGKMPCGVTARGITLEGFLFLHVLFIERGRLESTWAVLRKFGYNDEVLLADEVLDRINFHSAPDHVWELSDVGLDFLVRKFSAVDDDRDGLISWQQLDALADTIPPPVWQGEPWVHLLVPGMYGAAHKLEAFLLKWQLAVALDPRTAYGHLLYLGFGGPDGAGGPALLARGVRRRTDKRHRADLLARTTVQCLVFGPRGAGKTSLLRALVGQQLEGTPTRAPAAAVAAGPPLGGAAGDAPGLFGIDKTAKVAGLPVTALAGVPAPGTPQQAIRVAGPAGAATGGAASGSGDGICWTALSLVRGADDKERTLILHEVGEELETQMLTAAALATHGAPAPLVASSHSTGGPPALDLSRADVAAFVFDTSSPASFRAAVDLLVKVSTYAGDTLPCVLVAAKDELAMSAALEHQVQSTVSELQLGSVVRTSAQLGELGGLFPTLVKAATAPDGWVPETPLRKAQRRFTRTVVTGVTAGVLAAATMSLTYYVLSRRASATAAPTPTPTASIPSATAAALLSTTARPAPAPALSTASAAAAVAPVLMPVKATTAQSPILPPTGALAPAPPPVEAASLPPAAGSPGWPTAWTWDALVEWLAALLGPSAPPPLGQEELPPPPAAVANAKAHSISEPPRTAATSTAAAAMGSSAIVGAAATAVTVAAASATGRGGLGPAAASMGVAPGWVGAVPPEAVCSDAHTHAPQRSWGSPAQQQQHHQPANACWGVPRLLRGCHRASGCDDGAVPAGSGDGAADAAAVLAREGVSVGGAGGALRDGGGSGVHAWDGDGAGQNSRGRAAMLLAATAALRVMLRS